MSQDQQQNQEEQKIDYDQVIQKTNQTQSEIEKWQDQLQKPFHKEQFLKIMGLQWVTLTPQQLYKIIVEFGDDYQMTISKISQLQGDLKAKQKLEDREIRRLKAKQQRDQKKEQQIIERNELKKKQEMEKLQKKNEKLMQKKQQLLQKTGMQPVLKKKVQNLQNAQIQEDLKQENKHENIKQDISQSEIQKNDISDSENEDIQQETQQNQLNQTTNSEKMDNFVLNNFQNKKQNNENLHVNQIQDLIKNNIYQGQIKQMQQPNQIDTFQRVRNLQMQQQQTKLSPNEMIQQQYLKQLTKQQDDIQDNFTYTDDIKPGNVRKVIQSEHPIIQQQLEKIQQQILKQQEEFKAKNKKNKLKIKALEEKLIIKEKLDKQQNQDKKSADLYIQEIVQKHINQQKYGHLVRSTLERNII